MKLYALHDKKAKAFTHFHVERSDVVASRGFAEAVVDPKMPYGRYADDYELVSLCDVSQDYDGDFPESIVGEYVFRVVITAAQVLAAQPPKPEQLQLLKEG